MSIRIGRGRQHDVSLARVSISDVSRYHYILADLAYQGLSHKVLTPLKSPERKNYPHLQNRLTLKLAADELSLRISIAD